MFIATVVAVLTMGTAKIDDHALKCAVMGSPTKATSKAIEFQGMKFPMCCGGCPSAFMAEPAKFIKEAAKSQGAIGVTMFDAVTGDKLDLEKSKDSMEFKGILYAFSNADDLAKFKANPESFTKVPEKESLVCPMSGEKIAAYSEAGGYVDHKGVRYYACCPDCLKEMKAEPSKLEASKAVVTVPKAFLAPVKK